MHLTSFESGNLKKCKMGEELTKKKRIRAGHRASVTRIIAQVQQALESEELNSSKLKQQLQTLREKVDVLRKLDSDILSALETEEDITGDIEQADIVKETLESTIFDLEAALTTQEQNNLPTVGLQPTLRNPAPEQLLSSSRKVDSPRAQSTVAPQTQDNEAAGSSAPVVPERSNTESARAHGCKVRLPKLTLKIEVWWGHHFMVFILGLIRIVHTQQSRFDRYR